MVNGREVNHILSKRDNMEVALNKVTAKAMSTPRNLEKVKV